MNNNIHLFFKMKIFKKKNKIKSALNTFRTNSKLNKKDSNHILKMTKSIILNKSIKYNSLQDYINNNLNNSVRQKSDSINPINENPILFQKSFIISPNKFDYINMIKYNNKYNEDTTNNSALNNNSFILMNKALTKRETKSKTFYFIKNEKKINKDNNNNSDFNIKKKIFLKFKKQIYDYQKEKEKEKEFQSIKLFNKTYNNLKNNFDSLFIEFFYKWYKNSNINQGIKSIINNKYSNLIYNENEIFYYDLSYYIHNKINEYKLNNIQNLQDRLQSNFYDINNKEIKLALLGMKLTFIPQNKKNKNINLYLPFTYSILFYYKGINFFREILLAMIHFNNHDYDDISIDYDEINCFIKRKIILDNIYKENINNNNAYTPSDFIKRTRRKKRSNSLVKRKSNEFFFIKQNYRKMRVEKEYIPIFSRENKHKQTNVKFNQGLKDYKLNNKKNVSIHSSSDKNDNTFYNSYCFIWETPKISYKLVLEMPKLIFKYQDISKTISIFCNKNIMLFLLKKNFINWDFYLMNYLFSIKSFRKIIINNYACKSYKSSLDINKNSTQKENDSLNKKEKQKNKSIEIKIRKNSEFLEDNLINNSFQQFNEKNEIYYFFYTNITNINSLILFHSYKILINYDKLNPNFSWEYFLNFKQMKFLNEIKKYEILENFLKKAIKTNFEKGSLFLDLTVFADFNPNIMNYEKKDVIMPYNIENKKINVWKSFRKPKKDMILKIQNPSIKIEKYIHTNKSNNDKNNNNDNLIKELNDDFLKKIDKQKMKFWPHNFIEFIEENKLIDNNNIKIYEYPLLPKDNFKKRIKRRATTLIVSSNKVDKIRSVTINKYLK